MLDPARVINDPDAWDDVVSRFAEIQQRRAALEAEEVRLLAEAVDVVRAAEATYRGRPHGDRSIPLRSLVAELAVATRLSERTIKRALNDSFDLCDRFTPAVEALEAGRISRRHLAVIHDAAAEVCDDEVRDRVVDLALERAEETTPGRLGPIVEAIAARLEPRTVEERHAAALERRDVWMRAVGDGLSDVTARVSTVHGAAMLDRLSQLAASVIDARPPVEQAGDESDAVPEPDMRTIAQVRADIVTDLVLAGTPQTCIAGDGESAIRGVVQVTVPVLTAAGVGDEPALLAGSGPIGTDTARRLLGRASGWERVMTSPVSGAVLCVDRYRPGPALTRLLVARDERCRFPGCRRPIWRSDIDHTIPASLGGATAAQNLAHLCRGHHTLKHHGAWGVRQLPGGVLEWTSPTGRVATDRPEPTVRFVPSGGPPPRPDGPPPRPDGPPNGARARREYYMSLPHDPLVRGTTPF